MPSRKVPIAFSDRETSAGNITHSHLVKSLGPLRGRVGSGHCQEHYRRPPVRLSTWEFNHSCVGRSGAPVAKALDVPGRLVRVLLLYFLKAFDRVDHSLLLEKFGNLDLPDFPVRWLTSFLCQRRHKVKLGSAQSEWGTVNAGVSHGTVSGPVGFLLHINDLHSICDSTKYPDDTTFWES